MDVPFRLILFLLPLLAFLAGCTEQRSHLEQVQREGVLRVITRNSPTTYYITADGPAGVEYELASGFADYLGVRLEILLPLHDGDIVPMVQHRRVDLAAAGLAATELRSQQLRFSTPYLHIRQQLVYRRGCSRPEGLEVLDGNLGVVANSSHEELLRELSKKHPQLEGTTYADEAQHELLEMINTGELDYAVVNSNEFTHGRRYYPDTAIAFNLTDELDVAWAFSKQADPSLYMAARQYFGKLQRDGELEQLLSRYYTWCESPIVCRNTGHISGPPPVKKALTGACWQRSVTRNRIGTRMHCHQPASGA